jgi:hypothetical protein
MRDKGDKIGKRNGKIEEKEEERGVKRGEERWVNTSDRSTVHFLGVGEVCTLSRPALVLQRRTVALVNTTTSSAIWEDTCRLLRGVLKTRVEAAEIDSPWAQPHSV